MISFNAPPPIHSFPSHPSLPQQPHPSPHYVLPRFLLRPFLPCLLFIDWTRLRFHTRWNFQMYPLELLSYPGAENMSAYKLRPTHDITSPDGSQSFHPPRIHCACCTHSGDQNGFNIQGSSWDGKGGGSGIDQTPLGELKIYTHPGVK